MEKDKCLFCFGEDNLIENTKCPCKFHYHNECYTVWIENKNIICPICKKNIEIEELVNDLENYTLYKRIVDYIKITIFFIFSAVLTIIAIYLFFVFIFGFNNNTYLQD